MFLQIKYEADIYSGSCRQDLPCSNIHSQVQEQSCFSFSTISLEMISEKLLTANTQL